MIAQPARKISIFALAITVLWISSGCSSTPPAAPYPGKSDKATVSRNNVGRAAARIAADQVGVPYRYGGSTPSGFDCSGLVQYSYSRAGKDVPRTTGQLWSVTEPVARQQMRVGDLLFFSVAGKMSHVGLYLGEQRFVHAPSTGRSVSIASLDSPYYDAAFVRAGRPR